jgi:hypothetical protein
MDGTSGDYATLFQDTWDEYHDDEHGNPIGGQIN